MPSPVCTVNGTATPGSVAAGASFTIALANPAGAAYWGVSATSTDETNATTSVNATIVINEGAKTATCDAPASDGSAVIFTSIVGVSGPGLDANGVFQPSYVTTFKVNVPTTGGYVVWALNETSEQSAAFGSIVEVNAIIRGVGNGGGTSQSANTTGAAQSGSFAISAAASGKTVTYTMTATMRVVSVVGTPTEAVGDSWTTTGDLTWKNVSGTQTVVPALVGLSPIGGDASMSTGAAVTQTNGGVTFLTPSGLDGSTVVSVTITYSQLGTSP